MNFHAKVGRLIRELSERNTTTNAAMKHAIKSMSHKCLRGYEHRLAPINWGSADAAFVRWMSRSLKYIPLQPEVVGLWFDVPDVNMNEPLMHFVGTDQFDERVNEGDWAAYTCWTQDEDGRAGKKVPETHPPEFTLRPLAAMKKKLGIGWGSSDEDRPEKLSDFVTALSLVYVSLLLRRGLAKVKPELLLSQRVWLGVGFGFCDGDMYLTGVLTKAGWTKPARKHRRTKEPTPPTPTNPNPELDLNSDKFSPRKYFEAGLDVNAKDAYERTVLTRAVQWRAEGTDWQLVEALMRAGADPRVVSYGNYTVLLSLVDGPQSVVASALDAGADPNFRNANNIAAIHCASRTRVPLENLRLLLQRGANPNLPGMFGRRPLHELAESGPGYFERIDPLDHIRVLVSAGADIEGGDENGTTPLMHSVYRFVIHYSPSIPFPDDGNDLIAIAMLRAGASPNCRFGGRGFALLPLGATPLMCQRYDEGNLHLALLEHGADVTLTCNKGKTALDYARAALKNPGKRDLKGIHRVVEAIEQRMATVGAHFES